MNNTEGYTPPHVAETMLRDVEGYIRAEREKKEHTKESREILSLLQAERAAILEIINTLL